MDRPESARFIAVPDHLQHQSCTTQSPSDQVDAEHLEHTMPMISVQPLPQDSREVSLTSPDEQRPWTLTNSPPASSLSVGAPLLQQFHYISHRPDGSFSRSAAASTDDLKSIDSNFLCRQPSYTLPQAFEPHIHPQPGTHLQLLYSPISSALMPQTFSNRGDLASESLRTRLDSGSTPLPLTLPASTHLKQSGDCFLGDFSQQYGGIQTYSPTDLYPNVQREQVTAVVSGGAGVLLDADIKMEPGIDDTSLCVPSTSTATSEPELAYTIKSEQDLPSPGYLLHFDRGQSVPTAASKPETPYSQLIYRALMSVPDHVMTLQQIYQWFRENTDKDKHSGKGWQNSIRHNLSMNKAFKKASIPAEDRTGASLHAAESKKKSSEWVLEDWAHNGVQSTTRYRTSSRRTIVKKEPALRQSKKTRSRDPRRGVSERPISESPNNRRYQQASHATPVWQTREVDGGQTQPYGSGHGAPQGLFPQLHTDQAAFRSQPSPLLAANNPCSYPGTDALNVDHRQPPTYLTAPLHHSAVSSDADYDEVLTPEVSYSHQEPIIVIPDELHLPTPTASIREEYPYLHDELAMSFPYYAASEDHLNLSNGYDLSGRADVTVYEEDIFKDQYGWSGDIRGYERQH